jgi:hypothetical protein
MSGYMFFSVFIVGFAMGYVLSHAINNMDR